MKRRRFLSWLAVAGLLFGLGLAVANVVDYVRYHRAIARAKGLTEAQLRAIGDRCRAVSQPGRFEGSKVPVEFALLEPLNVTVYEGIGYAMLYECGEIHVSVDVDTSPHNQRISLSTRSPAGLPTNLTLWQRDPVLAKQLAPDRRLVTVSFRGIHNGQEWIVLENEVRVVDSERASRTEEALVTSAPLTPRDRAEIADLVRAIGPEVRGKDWRLEGVVDGWWLSIRFSQSGERGPDDIQLNNVWIDEISPLIEAISQFAPKDYPINYRQLITADPDLRTFRPIVRTLKEAEAQGWPPPRTP